MKKRIAYILSVLLLLCMSFSAMAEATSWASFAADPSAYSSLFTVAKQGGFTVVTGAEGKPELSGVRMDSRTDTGDFGPGKYRFENVTLSGIFSVTSHDNNHYEIVLDKSVKDQTEHLTFDAGLAEYHKPDEDGNPVAPTLEKDGHIVVHINCDIGSVNANASENSHLKLYVNGNANSVDCRASIWKESKTGTAHADAVIKGKQIGTLCAEAGLNSHISIDNQSDFTREIRSWAISGGKLKFVSSADCELVDFQAEAGGDVQFTNNGTILNTKSQDGNAWGDYAVMFSVDKDSSLKLDGKGRILPGTQVYSYHWGKENPRISEDGIPGASIVCNIRALSDEEINYADGIDIVRNVAKNIQLDWDQLVPGKAPHLVVAVKRGDYPLVYPLSKEDLHRPVLNTKDDIEGNRTSHPQILMDYEHHYEKGSELFLKAEKYPSSVDGSVLYEIKLVDDKDVPQDITSYGGKEHTAMIYLPYPSSMSLEDARNREFVIRHDTGKGIDVYSTADGTAQRLEKGLLIEVNSLSPFEIIWDVSVPGTGDSSRFALFAALLLISMILLHMKAYTRKKA